MFHELQHNWDKRFKSIQRLSVKISQIFNYLQNVTFANADALFNCFNHITHNFRKHAFTFSTILKFWLKHTQTFYTTSMSLSILLLPANFPKFSNSMRSIIIFKMITPSRDTKVILVSDIARNSL